MNTSDDPRDFGFRMPAEWAPHDACWMAWPCREGLWANTDAVQRDYANVANTIARYEPVKMLAPPALVSAARARLDAGVEVIEMPIDDSWARDSGPNFLVGPEGLAGSAWTFNAWGGKYRPFDEDARMAERILALVGARCFRSALTAEGGGITVDGEGTVITTESCFLNRNRNPGWSREDVDAELCRTLGAEKVIWIPGDPEETETDGHVDGIAAFIEPGRVLVEINRDKTDPHYEVGIRNRDALKDQRDAKGRRLELEFIQEGIYHEEQWNGGCSSYVNSYLANGAVIVPAYGYEHDAAAVETYQALYPERIIEQVPIRHLALGGGGIHCVTQQQPVVPV
ncbi:MAG: agmatine deiminase family protein [Woeseiaceae bacterium]|nr:agmatine deiminase family protein [Woeseiaceae bacterium]